MNVSRLRSLDRPEFGNCFSRWKVPGLYISRKVHRSVGRHQSQRRWAASRHTQSDPLEGDSGQPGEPEQRWRQRRQRPLVQIQRRRARQHEGQTDADLAVRQGGQQVQELREPPRTLNQNEGNLDSDSPRILLIHTCARIHTHTHTHTQIPRGLWGASLSKGALL